MKLFLYLERISWLHKADPRSKLLALLGVFFAALSVNGIQPLLILLGMIILTGCSAGFYSNLKKILPLLLMIMLFSVVIWTICGGDQQLWGIFKADGMLYGLCMGIKLDSMIIAGLIWLSTTKIEELVLGMRKIGVPYRIAFAFSTAVRLVPWIVQSCVTVGEAQEARGLEMNKGNILVRLKKYLILLVPALAAVVRNANQFAMALESRGFSSAVKRTSYLKIGFRMRDLLLILGTAVMIYGLFLLDKTDLKAAMSNAVVIAFLVIGFILLLRLSVRRKGGQVLWQNTRMVVLTALSAGIYAAFVIPFKGIVLVPGVSDFRPGLALPPVLGILFGPSAAWGSGFGCVISDFFGSIGPGSFFGFAGNFALAWIPYRLWWKTGLVRRDDLEPYRINSFAKTANFILLSLLGTFACALIIGWGLDLLGLVPFQFLAVVVSINTAAPIVILSTPLLMLLYPRIKNWRLLWTDIVGEEGVELSVQRTYVGALCTTLGVVIGLAGGLYVAVVLGSSPILIGALGLMLIMIGAYL